MLMLLFQMLHEKVYFQKFIIFGTKELGDF